MRKLPFMLCLVQMHALVMILMGGVCLVGRILGHDVLATWKIDSVGMAGSTAVTFMVTGVTVLVLASKWQNLKNGKK